MALPRLGSSRLAAVAALAALSIGVGLGRAGRLTYHEAFVAQAAREMLASGHALIPTVGNRPWLEKPPLGIWLVALTARVSGFGVVDEWVARAPSAFAAALLALGVATFASRRFGPSVGLLAGLIQVTTAWTVMRGRLAEADMLLACLVAWTLVAFDHLRDPEDPASRKDISRWRWAFFAGLGLTSLAKGVGFGAALVLAVVAVVLVWERDRETFRRLKFKKGWLLAATLGLAWPLAATLRHPSALGLWALHITDRLAAQPEHFTGQPWSEYLPTILAMLLPWTPFAIAGACRSIPRAFARGFCPGDRLLWAWTIAPLALLSLATVKHAHYAIHALPPCSIWAAQGLLRLGERLQTQRGWTPSSVRRSAFAAFAALGCAYALGFAFLGPRLDRRGVEWAFYQDAARLLQPNEPVALLYHVPDWDRFPYQTPFGPVPHDWAVRLFYLNHPAPCRFSLDEIAQNPVSSQSSPFAVIGRESDLLGLRRLGAVEILAQGPPVRADRTYRLYRVTPEPTAIATQNDAPSRR